MSSDLEKNLDDYFYEDEFYDKEIECEELPPGDEADEEFDSESVAPAVEVIFICEECANRWDDVISPDDDDAIFCPSCGSQKVEQV